MPRASTLKPAPAAGPSARVPTTKTTIVKETIEAPASGAAVEEAGAEEPFSRKEELRQELSELDFWEKLKAIPTPDWEHRVSAYLYRVKGDYREEGRPFNRPPRGSGYLEIFTQPFTIEEIRQRFGGGTYWCMVNWDAKGEHGGLFSGKFTIIGQAKTDTTAGAPNQSTEEFLIRLVEKQMADVKANLTKPDEAVAKVMEMMGKANDATVKMLEKQIPQASDPMTQLSSMLALLKDLRTIDTPAPKADADSGFIKNLELFERLGLLSKRNDNPLDGVGKVFESLKSLGIIPAVGGTGGGGRDDWKVALANTAPQILQHVEGIVSRVVQGIIQTRGPSPVQAAQIAAGSARPGTILAGSRAASGATPGGAAGAPPPPAAPPPPGASAGNAAPAPAPGSEAEQIAQAQVIVESWMWLRLVELFKGGTSGDDVASFLQLAAPEAATYFGAMTPAELETMIQGHPILGQIAQHPRLKAFIEEFHSYFTEEPAEGEEPNEKENA
ncbi:MAG: hypothetical protein ABSF73_03070 [Terriglobia bacterium]